MTMQPRTSEFSAMSAAAMTAWYHSGKSTARAGEIAFCGCFWGLGAGAGVSDIKSGAGFTAGENFFRDADRHRQHGDEGNADEDFIEVLLREGIRTQTVTDQDNVANPERSREAVDDEV